MTCDDGHRQIKARSRFTTLVVFTSARAHVSKKGVALPLSTYVHTHTQVCPFIDFLVSTRFVSNGDPPDLAEESKPSPAQKVKRESPGESLGESPSVPADPPKRVKNESPGDSASQKSPVF